jgi:hypothetical protein
LLDVAMTLAAADPPTARVAVMAKNKAFPQFPAAILRIAAPLRPYPGQAPFQDTFPSRGPSTEPATFSAL